MFVQMEYVTVRMVLLFSILWHASFQSLLLSQNSICLLLPVISW